ncbi:oxidoreductase [Sphingobium sp. GW456-12-10-14-TSB1]|jgi:putative NADPH-quinone reductase|uniref:NAD(P)H-dependent oxidoreductase n=1 Tax=Novosphingobium soli TaxID=574956 RepID=A0ABV6CR48_9SPHN|nr:MULTISPECIES: NAD(P)H-dependent oxidoreductase [unclassified Sphingobium]MBS88229.1 flavodoxin family protein [Sphingobium sp.]MBU1825839.1 NAD(P)H-dependent oxidoreductase [Alphaproteobacteria bacterium]OUC54524.1 oxidoreductase [Sphingobium sp. GW456-12-10-14-TSB1]
MRVLILDGHPDDGRLITHLLDHYHAKVASDAEVERIALRDLDFDPILRHGYKVVQPWEPDLERVGAAIAACDHLVVAFPMWWGSEPAQLKGLIDRVLLPGFAFRYHRDNPLWDRLLAGRSADVLITTDTPSWYLRWAYGNPVVRRWRGQILGFCGFKPLRITKFGPVRQGGVEKNIAAWCGKIERLAASAFALRRGTRLQAVLPNDWSDDFR